MRIQCEENGLSLDKETTNDKRDASTPYIYITALLMAA